MPLGDLTRDELIALVDQIMRMATADEEEDERLLELFESSVPYPGASDLIFYPDVHFGPEYRERIPTPEQVVDAALSYRAVELGPASDG